MNELLGAGAHIGLLIIRLGMGFLFIIHGYPKMTGRWVVGTKGSRESFIESIRGLGLPFAHQLAVVLGAVMFFGGILLSVGLWTRGVALILSVIMVVAFGRNYFRKGFLGSGDFPFSVLVALLGLVFLGSGFISLDGWLLKP